MVAHARMALISILVIVSGGLGRNIRDIDFGDESFPFDDTRTVPAEWRWIEVIRASQVKLEKGRHEFGEGDTRGGVGRPALMLESIAYGDLTGDGLEDAVVNLRYSTGGTAAWNYVYVFGMEDGELKVVSVLESGSRAAGGLLRVAVDGRDVVMEFADVSKRVAECCSEGFVRVRYRLDARGEFVEAGERVRGDVKLSELPLRK